MKTLPNAFFFETEPTFEEVKKLPKDSVYIVGELIDCDWKNNTIIFDIYKATDNEFDFEYLTGGANYLFVEAKNINYGYDVAETPYAFNSESGNISYHETNYVSGVCFDNSEISKCFEHHDVHLSGDAELTARVKKLADETKAFFDQLNSADIIALINNSGFGDYLDAYADEKSEEILRHR